MDSVSILNEFQYKSVLINFPKKPSIEDFYEIRKAVHSGNHGFEAIVSVYYLIKLVEDRRPDSRESHYENFLISCFRNLSDYLVFIFRAKKTEFEKFAKQVPNFVLTLKKYLHYCSEADTKNKLSEIISSL